MTEKACSSEMKEGILRMNCLGCIFGASVEDFDVCMARVIDKIREERKVQGIILAESREYEYDYDQTQILTEIAEAINEILRKKIVSVRNLGRVKRFHSIWYSWLHTLVTTQLRGDPIGAYVNLTREIRHLKSRAIRSPDNERDAIEDYLQNALYPIQDILEECKMIKLAKPFLTGHHIGDRKIYRELLFPSVRPNFMLTKYMSQPPPGEMVDKYKVKDYDIEIFKVPGKVRHFYHITPPEFRLTEEEYTLLDAARRILEQRRPKELEMRDQDKMRDLFNVLSIDLLRDLSEQMRYKASDEQIDRLAGILTRYTAGLGILELMLADNKVQDVFINSPMGRVPVFVNHQDYEECETNLVPSRADGDRWATRFKLLSGRPLDEANPVLDTELEVPGGVARVAVINPRLSPDGLGFALRRHRYKPWTFPLFIDNGYMNPLLGGLMWFTTSYGRTMLVAGTRGAGKSSLLGSMMLQILPYFRIITVEDTLELPVKALRKIGYNIERMKSRSVITRVEIELSADDALRTALRLGDSSLIIGEVRSAEAKALYEAMRIGAMANTVAGTIHGESAYGVFDRVVNDLGVPKTSFKATDLVIVCNKLRSSDGLHSTRRVVEVTEVRKHWKDDPADENGFVNLMEYDSKTDSLKPTDIFINGESYVLNQIASRIPGMAGRWDLIWEDINTRAKVLKKIGEIANQTGNKNLMEAETTVKCNQMYHTVADRIREEVGSIDYKRVYDEWLEWFKKTAKGA